MDEPFLTYSSDYLKDRSNPERRRLVRRRFITMLLSSVRYSAELAPSDIARDVVTMATHLMEVEEDAFDADRVEWEKRPRPSIDAELAELVRSDQ